MLLHHFFYIHFETACKSYFTDGDIDSMLNTLEPLHRQIEEAELRSSYKSTRNNATGTIGTTGTPTNTTNSTTASATTATTGMKTTETISSFDNNNNNNNNNSSSNNSNSNSSKTENAPLSMREISFIHCFGRDLRLAKEWCDRYKTSLSLSDINQAWQLYYRVFKDIQKQLPQLKIVRSKLTN